MGLIILLSSGILASDAGVVELADTLALGASAARCAGSSPVPGTKNISHAWDIFIASCNISATLLGY